VVPPTPPATKKENPLEKKVGVSEVGNAYVLQLLIDKDGSLEDHGKPVVVLDTASDKELGEAVRGLFRARIRAKKEKGTAEVVAPT
jgi:hypothetical protein